MILTFTALLFAHVLADFVFQTGWMVANKRKPQALLLHVLVVLITAQLALGHVTAWELLALAGLHLIIDAIKTFGRVEGLTAFIADQIAHILSLLFIASIAPDLWATGLWAHLPGTAWMPQVFALLTGLILTTRAGGFAVGLLMAPYRDADLPEGLTNGGAVIGLLERGLIYLMILVGQPAGIGFLIAAKSVLRFDTAKENQKAGEYVIIGTLASFGWAMAAAYAINFLRSYLPPLEIGG